MTPGQRVRVLLGLALAWAGGYAMRRAPLTERDRRAVWRQGYRAGVIETTEFVDRAAAAVIAAVRGDRV